LIKNFAAGIRYQGHILKAYPAPALYIYTGLNGYHHTGGQFFTAAVREPGLLMDGDSHSMSQAVTKIISIPGLG